MSKKTNKMTESNSILCPYDSDCPIKDLYYDAIAIANLGIFQWHLSTDQVILSDEAFAITGIDRTTFDGKMKTLNEHHIHLESREEFKKALVLALEKKIIRDSVYRLIHPSLSECWVKFRSQLHFDQDGDPLKVSGVLMDVSEDYIIKKSLKKDLDFVQTLLELIPNPIFYKDYHGQYKYFNSAFENYLGIDKEHLLDKTVFDIAPKHLAEIYHKADSEIITSKKDQVYETKVKYADDSLHDVIFRKGVHKKEDGEVLGLIGIMEDVTEQRQLEEKLLMLDHAKEVFLELNNCILNYTDDREFLTHALLKFKEIFKLAEYCILINIEDSIDIPYHKGLIVPENLDYYSFEIVYDWAVKSRVMDKIFVFNKENIETFASNSPIRMIFSTNNLNSAVTIPITVENKARWIFCYASKGDKIISNNESAVALYIREQINVIYKVFELYKKIVFMSRFDGLTGLMNRMYFDENLQKSIDQALIEKTALKVVVFDLDNLKRMNDCYGHLAGDKLIQRFAELLKNSSDYNQYFGRIGGDEFVGVYHQVDSKVLETYLEKMRESFMENEAQLDFDIIAGFSYGVSTYPDSATDIKGLIKAADKKMYDYKELMKKN
ncbi:MAG: diguanylate cyclase [Clostridiales bacterium]|nr:diguanylate cyclase [Clostridiales bacterium]